MAKYPLVYSSKNNDRFRIAQDSTFRMFVSFFAEEVSLRDRVGRHLSIKKSIVKRYPKMLDRMAKLIWDASKEWMINPVNFTFLFLNRYYPLFVAGRRNPVNGMPSCWDEFLIEVSHEEELLTLMNYDDGVRSTVCAIIDELRETKDSNVLKRFLDDYVKGYAIRLPRHRYSRSKLFETVLVMIHQVKERGLSYFVDKHASEIIKAHAYYLKKFGDPISLELGHLIGENALGRLQRYYEWVQKVEKRQTYTVDATGKVRQRHWEF